MKHMKIVVIGDIHGRDCWKNIVEIESDYDLLIFLGDYVSTHENISEDTQIENLKEILQYREDNADKVVLLRGNHDMQHLGYHWSGCSGLFPNVQNKMNYRTKLGRRFLKDTKWLHYDKFSNILYSHAGLTNTWFEHSGAKNIEDINNLKPSPLFGFNPDNPWDYYGDSISQPITWVRPSALAKDSYKKEGLIQVFGHTTNYRIIHEADKNYDFWMCDCLPSEYLVVDITDKPEFIVKSLHREFTFGNRYGETIKLVNIEEDKFKLILPKEFDDYTRVIINGDTRCIEAVDPPGGPYISVGSKIAGLVIQKIELINGEFIMKIVEDEEI